jgi:hypothetical protein
MSHSPEDITKVKDNLNRMISFNQDLLNNVNYKIENAFALLSQTDNSDLGVELGIDLLSESFYELASAIAGPVGAISASFLTALVCNYKTTKPVSLNEAFSSLLIRVQKTILQTNQDLSIYYQDPVAYWDVTLSGSYTTPFGTFTASGKVGDLATITFPNKDDPEYYNILNACLKGMDQGVWATLLKRFVITYFEEDVSTIWYLPFDPNAYDNGFFPVHKSFYDTWTYQESTDCYGNVSKYYIQQQYNIGSGASAFSSGRLSDSACDYLFVNYASDIANPDGLFQRDFVFTNLGIPRATHHIHNATALHGTTIREVEPTFVNKPVSSLFTPWFSLSCKKRRNLTKKI